MRQPHSSPMQAGLKAVKAMEPGQIVWEAIVNGDDLRSYDPVEKIVIVLTDGYSYDLTPMECTQLICRVRKTEP